MTFQGVSEDVELAPPTYKGVFHGDYSDLPVNCSPSDTLALKSYVDRLIGDIDSVLDTINGEVI